MMKRFSKFALINLFCLTTLPAVADDSLNQYGTQQTATNTQNLVQYLLNLGGYLGYNLTQSPTANNATVSQTLLNATATQVLETFMFNTFLGAIPVNSALAQFLPAEGGIPNAAAINAFANNVFNSQNYSNPQSQQQGTVAVSTAIDQPSFQQDPVSQSVLNILSTPDVSYCMTYDGSSWQGCSQVGGNSNTILPASGVTSNIIGTLPSTYQYYTYQYNQQLISQLNSNSLTAPLLYATQNASANSTSSPSTNNQNTGLNAQTQAQQAANFVRYVSGAVTPLQLPKLKAYDTLYTQAQIKSGATPTIQQVQAQATLDNYFTTLRTYAAQYSVGISNLYFIMSKRLPQNQSGTSQSTPSSQALSEFNMATWRLCNPDISQNNQWLNQINNASPATVEKEIASLLAEMNYQMYLDRQIQERLLLTNSVMLLKSLSTTPPNSDLSNSAAQSSSSSQ
jgi:intracellular multiplication protein IcmX